MKILVIHSDPTLPARQSIDLWRIIRPFKELQKYVAWQIDTKPYLINLDLLDKDSKVETEKLVEEIEQLKDYDIIWSSYFPDAVLFDVMTFMREKYGTKFVLDVDDDMFHIPADNGVWKSAGIRGVQDLRYMVREAPYLVTTTPELKAVFDKERSNPTYVLPNFINDDYTHKPFDNGDKIIISFFGSVTHKNDLTATGFVDALQRIMHKYKNVYAGTVGLPIHTYLPKERYTFYPGKPGQAWLDEVWPNINCDIAVAPLEDTQFNRGRSNIKWLETTMIPAAFVGSNIPPYATTVEDGKTGLLVENNSGSWFEALEKLVLDKQLRQQLTKNAQTEVKKNWCMDTQWVVLRDIINSVNNTEEPLQPLN